MHDANSINCNITGWRVHDFNLYINDTNLSPIDAKLQIKRDENEANSIIISTTQATNFNLNSTEIIVN